MALLTQKYLKECIVYSGVTGEFYWKVRPKWHFSTSRSHKIWNTRFSGKPPSLKTCTGGYRRLAIDGVSYRLHQLAWLYVHGVYPDNIDHIDGNKCNNKIINLTNCSQLVNMKNMKKNCNNTSGQMGVSFNRKRNHWVAIIEADTKKRYLGSFKTFELAVAARKAAEVMYGFNKNHGRRL